jgi:hypothetical protein
VIKRVIKRVALRMPKNQEIEKKGLYAFYGFKLALVVEADAKTATNAIVQIKTGKNSSRETDRASVPGPCGHILCKALI